jgi:hypothetical protein
MKNRHYKRKPGDFEIRILNSGKVIMIIPDEALMEIARIVEPNNCALPPQMEKKDNVGKPTSKTK